MHFWLINQYYPPDTAPTGCYLHEVAVALRQRGHEVTVFCSRRAYNGREVYPAEELLEGVRVVRVRAGGFGRMSSLGKLLDYASFYISLAFTLVTRRPRPDLVLALTTPPHLGLLARWVRAPHAHWIMDIYPDVLAAHGALSPSSWTYRLLARLTRRELRGSPLVLCLGDDMAERLRGYLAPGADAALHALPLWSAPELAPWTEPAPPPFRAEQGWGERDLVLMYSGNMGRGHRLGEFLAAAARTKHDRSMHWVFAGGGKRRAEVEESLRRDPALNARLLPYAPADRLREHLCSADVHLVSLDDAWQGCMVPSKFQGIFAVGKPVIFVGGADNSLAQWIRASGGGWTVPADDVPALLAAVEAARDPEERRRRSDAARAFAAKHFDRGHNVERLLVLLEAAARRATVAR